MHSDDLGSKGPSSLLSTYATVLRLLRKHGVVRSFNNPVADIAEWIVSKKLSLKLADKSAKAYDATDTENRTYQIKGRWRPGDNRSTQLGAIRDLDTAPFDFLVAVMFDSDFIVEYAAVIPVAVVQKKSTYVKRTNSSRFNFTRSILNEPGVLDITAELQVFPATEQEERQLVALQASAANNS